MGARTVDGQAFVRMISGGAANLKANAAVVNELNVFPIPDGDTGENMCLTMDGGLRCLDGYTERSIEKAAELLADGMLMSARGNSGVILSQLFSGIAEGLHGKETATVEDLAAALRSGVKSAYAAVMEPTEGTILTVAREATEFAASRLTPESTLESFGQDYIRELGESLNRTPELLDVLKEAGVIDSGGAGLYYIADGVVRAANGESIEAAATPSAAQPGVDLDAFTEESVMEYGYCTEFLLRLQKSKTDLNAFSVDDLTARLQNRGDSIVAFQNGSLVKVHIHTMTPGAVLNICQLYGEFLTVKIENMTLQHHESVAQNRFAAVSETPRRPFALVAVATGEGIQDTFRELGADYIIDGGQGKNPSTEDFIRAFERLNAETVFVLPNNGNILLAAQQAARLYADAQVYVVESRNIGEGYAALTMLSYDSGDAETIYEGLREAIGGVTTGMVTRSVRDATLDGVAIREGSYIGFTDKTMLASAPGKTETALALLRALDAAEHEFLIVIYGAPESGAERDELRRALRREYPRMELYEIDGGQDVYDLMVILQ